MSALVTWRGLACGDVMEKAGLAQLEASGQTQLSRTDADARLLSKNGQTVGRL